MKLSEVTTENQLWGFMTTPSSGLVQALAEIGDGDMMVLGGSGKMGKELIGLVQSCDRLNGVSRNLMVASTFSNQKDLLSLQKLGVTCFQGDLSDETFLDSLPGAPYLVYMMGFKFGSGDDWRRSFQMNSVVPYLVGSKYQESSIMVFSSGNPYPHTAKLGTGANEDTALDPVGIYGWTIVARESSFKTTAMQFPDQKISIYRLMYAQHLQYGVLVDLARMIRDGQPISLKMPAVNLISQRDANEVALKSFLKCNKAGWTVNAAGPVCQVNDIAHQLADLMGIPVQFADEAGELALLADDSLARSTFGEYRDSVDDMIEAAANWVKRGGDYWGKPTMFGRTAHDY